MDIELTLHCSDLSASVAFYDKIFWARPSERGAPPDRMERVAIANGVWLKLVERRNLPATRCSLEFNGFDVMTLWEKIRAHVPAYEGSTETMPNGHCWGPYEYPGGNAMAIKDPDGHYFSFAEW